MAVRNLEARASGDGGASPGEPPLLDDYVTVRLVQLAEIIARGASEVFETRFGVKNTELRILVQLSGRESLAVNELARRTRIDKGWISRSLKPLQTRGLVERLRHPTDTRASLVCLTEAGKALVAEVAPVARERQERLLAGLDRDEVYRVLDGLMARAQEILEHPDPGARPRAR